MTTEEIGRKLVMLCQEGKNLEALDTLYAKDAETIEAVGSPEMPARMKGVDARLAAPLDKSYRLGAEFFGRRAAPAGTK